MRDLAEWQKSAGTNARFLDDPIGYESLSINDILLSLSLVMIPKGLTPREMSGTPRRDWENETMVGA